MDEPPTVVKVAAVAHREHDGDPADYRVDLVNPATLSTLASLSPEAAITLAQGLCEQAHVALARARLLPAQER